VDRMTAIADLQMQGEDYDSVIQRGRMSFFEEGNSGSQNPSDTVRPS